MNAYGSIEAVAAAIAEDARGEIERLDREQAGEIDRLRNEYARTPVVVPDDENRVADARRRRRERLAEQDWLDRQTFLDAREAWTSRVAAAGMSRLRALDRPSRAADLGRLLLEGAERLRSAALVVLVAPEDADLLDAGARAALEASARGHIEIQSTAAVDTGGCIVQTPDGRLRFDNTFAARRQRFEALWRARLGDLFDAGAEPCAVATAAGRRPHESHAS